MQYRYSMLPGEHWWGGTTESKLCPLTEKSVYHKDFRIKCENQTMPLFLSDQGRYLWSDDPFRVDCEKGVFTFEGNNVELHEAGSTLRDAYRAAQDAHFPCDGVQLQPAFFRTAQYNTWMEFTYYPTQKGVLEYAEEWLRRGFAPGIFIIDEGWHEHTAYGSWDFDRARFPDPKSMVDQLHEMGFTVMLWVVPYVAPTGPAYVRSLRPLVGTDPEMAKHLYLRTTTGEVAMIKWWNGIGATLDMTNPYDRKFLDDQLHRLIREYGVDGFKFDGGTVEGYAARNVINGDLPADYDPHRCNEAWNEFGRRYPFHEYKDTYKGGGKNVIQRLRDRSHTWVGNGIDDLIPCAINAGLIGHPFLCPDMIGGGEWTYRFLPGFEVDEELFVRMAQCAALFPMMQFSWAPWKALSSKNVQLCCDAAKLHTSLVSEIHTLVRDAERTGEPILRSLEFNDPHRGYAEIDDEFMLGNRFLSAPVITKGTRERTVVFPKGRWIDPDGTVYEGRTSAVLKAPLEKLLWFRNLEE